MFALGFAVDEVVFGLEVNLSGICGYQRVAEQIAVVSCKKLDGGAVSDMVYIEVPLLAALFFDAPCI